MNAAMGSMLNPARRADVAAQETAYGVKVPSLVHVSGRHLSQAPNDTFAVEFDVEGTRYSLAQMLAANADDPAFCEWANAAKPGEYFPGIVGCQCLAAGDLSQADLIAIDKVFARPAENDVHALRCAGRL